MESQVCSLPSRHENASCSAGEQSSFCGRYVFFLSILHIAYSEALNLVLRIWQAAETLLRSTAATLEQLPDTPAAAQSGGDGDLRLVSVSKLKAELAVRPPCGQQ